MYIIEVSSGKNLEVEITPVEVDDYKQLSQNRYYFDWKAENKFEIYKLQVVGQNDILGLISFQRIPGEWRIHIRLLTVSKENKGKGKQYDRIAGNLIAFVAKIAVREFGEYACISMRPKSQITKHYMDKYNMTLTGVTLSLDVPEILDLIILYDNE